MSLKSTPFQLLFSLFLFLSLHSLLTFADSEPSENSINHSYHDNFSDFSTGELALRSLKNMINRRLQNSESGLITDADGNEISVDTLLHGNLTAFRYYPTVTTTLPEKQKYYFYFRYEPKDYSLIIAVYIEHGHRIAARCIHFSNHTSAFKMISKVHSNIQSLVAEVAKELSLDLNSISDEIPTTNNHVRKLVGLASFSALFPMLGICLSYVLSTNPIKNVSTCGLTLATTISVAFILDHDAD